jgi:hypothetical protein
MKFDKYYLLSKDTGNGPYLIGELKRISESEYQFKYMIKGDNFPEWFMHIPGMDDINKLYETEEVKNKIIHRVTPRKGSVNAIDMMKQNGLDVYDEWDLLESQMVLHEQYKADKFPLSDSHKIFYFYPELPMWVNKYDE